MSWSFDVRSWPCLDLVLVLQRQVLVLSWSCVGLVLVLSWSCLGLVLVLSWSCLGLVLVLSWSCLGLVLVLSWSCLGLVLVLSWFCFGLVLVLSWCFSCDVWFWSCLCLVTSGLGRVLVLRRQVLVLSWS